MFAFVLGSRGVSGNDGVKLNAFCQIHGNDAYPFLKRLVFFIDQADTATVADRLKHFFGFRGRFADDGDRLPAFLSELPDCIRQLFPPRIFCIRPQNTRFFPVSVKRLNIIAVSQQRFRKFNNLPRRSVSPLQADILFCTIAKAAGEEEGPVMVWA